LKYIELLSVAQQRAAQQRLAQQVSLATTSNNYLLPIPAQHSAAQRRAAYVSTALKAPSTPATYRSKRQLVAFDIRHVEFDMLLRHVAGVDGALGFDHCSSMIRSCGVKTLSRGSMLK